MLAILVSVAKDRMRNGNEKEEERNAQLDNGLRRFVIPDGKGGLFDRLQKTDQNAKNVYICDRN
jgi:hypothetical protein